MPSYPKLIAVFQDARKLLENPKNDFMWSSWRDTEHALSEVDGILAGLQSNTLPGNMAILFAPTGPMQEVAVASGWGEEFIDLANAYDEANAGSSDCSCLETPSTNLVTFQDMGVDRWGGEVEIKKCPECGQLWIHYYYVNEAFTGSGRWFMGAIPESRLPLVNVENAKKEIEMLPWHFFGGSYYDGKSGKATGRIRLRR